ncbi:MAG TPA: AMP-binding protein [Acidimicrobiales bacterium]|nr:AMP-binding protein [Acidimicrobiales bacterium]
MNLATIIDAHPEDAPALVSGDEVITYGELRRQAAGLRGGLARLGVKPGDRVAILCANTPAFVVSYLAALGVGAVAAPIDPAFPRVAIERELRAIGPRVVVVGRAGEGTCVDLDRQAVGVEAVIAAEGCRLDGAEDYEALVDGPPADTVARADANLAALLFTAGTGGDPKAAMLTHGNLLANLDQVQRFAGQAMQPEDVGLAIIPFFHIFGLNVVLGLPLLTGASLVLVEHFEAAATLALVAERKVTIVAGTPHMFAAWVAVEGATGDELRSIRLAVSGASPLPEDVGQAMQDRFGIPLWEGYGLTEAAPIVTSSLLLGRPRPGAIGAPLPGIELRLVDSNGQETLLGDAGEIWVKGPNVFAGYWNDPAATARVLTPDGWLRTGDVAVADEDGYLHIVDRAKDLIIVLGFNVYPAEVEEVLMTHPDIAEAAAIGVPNPSSGETVKAVVVLEPGSHLDASEVMDYCCERLARYKCPTEVIFAATLPHGATGKLLRRALL